MKNSYMGTSGSEFITANVGNSGEKTPAPYGNALAMAAASPKAGKPEDRGLADALESWLGPAADQIADLTALSDEELDRKLRAGNPVKFGDSGKFEAAMQRDMEAAARHGSQVHRR